MDWISDGSSHAPFLGPDVALTPTLIKPCPTTMSDEKYYTGIANEHGVTLIEKDVQRVRQTTLDEVREIIKHVDSTKYTEVGVKYAILQALDTLSTNYIH